MKLELQLFAVPFRKVSKTRGRKRRTHYKISANSTTTCPKCGDEKDSYEDICDDCKRKIEQTCPKCNGYKFSSFIDEFTIYRVLNFTFYSNNYSFFHLVADNDPSSLFSKISFHGSPALLVQF